MVDAQPRPSAGERRDHCVVARVATEVLGAYSRVLSGAQCEDSRGPLTELRNRGHPQARRSRDDSERAPAYRLLDEREAVPLGT
jgi:hypothetical protein